MPKISKPDATALYQALLRRDEAYDGFYFVCVRTTKIYCKLSCGARKPLESNVSFVGSIGEAEQSGYRACKMCKPNQGPRPKHQLTIRLLELLRHDSEKRWNSEELHKLGIDSSSARRAFTRDYGVSFLKFAREHRLGSAVATLTNGERVIDAQIDAGFSSASGFKDAVSREIGLNPSEINNSTLLSAKWLETPIGPMLAIVNNDGLQLLEFAERKALVSEITAIKKKIGPICFREHEIFNKLQRELDGYFAGSLKTFTIPLAQYGSAFEKAAWKALLEVPYGETRTYGEQAAFAGNQNAVRAIGRANGANKIAIIVPCHRIIGADGAMTGYGGKIWRKEWLLKHEAKYST